MKRNPPSEQKAQALRALLNGQDKSCSGTELVSHLVRLSTEKVIQELLEDEQTEFLGRERYVRSGQESVGQRNGYENGTLKTAEGVFNVKVPQVRGTEQPYRSGLWSNLSTRSEALERIVREMWVLGLSVRDVEAALMAATGAFVLSDTAVSQITEQLYEQYESFRQRDLSQFDVAYLFIDAVHEPLRRHGCSIAVLCAWGICTDGSRVLLSLTTGNTESYETSIELLRDMVRRGLHAPLTVTTDGAPGLTKAIDALWPRTWRVRCWFHKMRNLEDKVPPQAWPEFKALAVDVRDAPTFETGEKRMQALIKTYKAVYPEACRCLQDDTLASLNHLHVPVRHRQLVRTTNLVERSFVEERRRTKIIPHLWDEKSAIKLVFATLIRVSDRWSRRQFSVLEEQQLRQLRHERKLESVQEQLKEQGKQRRSAGQVAA